MNNQFKTRLQSFAWRLGMMILAIIVDQVARNLSLFAIPAEFTVVIGLVLGEVSKYLHNQTREQ